MSAPKQPYEVKFTFSVQGSTGAELSMSATRIHPHSDMVVLVNARGCEPEWYVRLRPDGAYRWVTDDMGKPANPWSDAVERYLTDNPLPRLVAAEES